MRILAIVAVALAGCAGKKEAAKASPEETARLQALADEVLAAGRAEDATRAKVVAEALTTIAPRADLGGCPVKLRVPYSADLMPGNLPESSADAKTVERLVVMPEEVATTRGRRLEQMETVVPYDVGRLNGENAADIEKSIRYFADMKLEPMELTMVVTARVDPKIVGGNSFESGAIEGRAYLYSYAQHAVVCAGDFRAQSSQMLSADSADVRLKVDLENEGERAAIAALVKAGPLE